MKTRQHIFLTKDYNDGNLIAECGRRFAIAPKATDDAPPCLRCKLSMELRDKLEKEGRLVETYHGHSLEYRLSGDKKVRRLSLGRGSKERAALLRGLCMKTILRTGKPIVRGPQCFADLA